MFVPNRVRREKGYNKVAVLPDRLDIIRTTFLLALKYVKVDVGGSGGT